MTEHSRDTAERDEINAYAPRFAAIREAKKLNRIVVKDYDGNVVLDVNEEEALAIMLGIDSLMVRWSQPMDIISHTGPYVFTREIGPGWKLSGNKFVYERK